MNVDLTPQERMESDLIGISGMYERYEVLALIFSRIAAGMEYKEVEHKDLEAAYGGKEPGWEEVEHNLKRMIEVDSKRAFQAGVDLVTLEESEEPEREKLNKWIRTSGLTILGMPGMRDMLSDYLDNGRDKEVLKSVLIGNMNLDLSSFEKSKDFVRPEGFTKLQTVCIAMGLMGAGGEVARELYDIAVDKKQEPATVRGAWIMHKYPGCEQFRVIMNPIDRES